MQLNSSVLQLPALLFTNVKRPTCSEHKVKEVKSFFTFILKICLLIDLMNFRFIGASLQIEIIRTI
jgi:hypothetical protein